MGFVITFGKVQFVSGDPLQRRPLMFDVAYITIGQLKHKWKIVDPATTQVYMDP